MNEHHIDERTQQTQQGKDYGQHTGSEQSFTHDPTQSAGLTLKARRLMAPQSEFRTMGGKTATTIMAPTEKCLITDSNQTKSSGSD
jgi:hypothetical protein